MCWLKKQWNIPVSQNIIGKIPHGKNVESLNHAVQGIVYGWHKYAGSKPPKGKQHQYRFTIYVLDCILHLSSNSTKKKFMKSPKTHILQQGTVVGLFE